MLVLILQTFNFAENGRHLSNQKYKACIRQGAKMCSIAYEPCSEQSFRIGPTRAIQQYPSNLNGLPPYPNYGGGFAYPNNYYPNGIISPYGGSPYANPYAANGIITPNGVIYDSNGYPIGTNVAPNALAGKNRIMPVLNYW